MNESLWLVEIDESDWDYDRFERAAVWAESADRAEQIVRAALRYPDDQESSILGEQLWIEDPDWKLSVEPAPTEGVALVHWHAG